MTVTMPHRFPSTGDPGTGNPPHVLQQLQAEQMPNDRSYEDGRQHDHIGLDTLSAELLAVVDQTMQPTSASMWRAAAPCLQAT
jgi:hypothetical protein